ncbi:MAG: site-specific integrase [Dermatophilaceae bacterium]
MSSQSTLLPFQPSSMTSAQLAAVSYLARYTGRTHTLYSFQLRQWFAWCESNGLDPLVGVQRAHVELYIRQLGESGLMDPSLNTMMHAVRGFFRFAHIDGLIGADPAVYARLPKIHCDESRTQGLDRLELIRFLQVAQTITVHHGALAYLLGINALRASEAAAVRIEDYVDTLRGYRVLHLIGKGNKPATMPITFPVLRVLEACRGQRNTGPLIRRPVSGRPIDRRDLPHVRPDRQDRGDPSAHQPALAAARRDHQRPRRGRPAAGCAGPGPSRRPPYHPALRPSPRQPRPQRRPLPHRLRRRRVGRTANVVTAAPQIARLRPD